MADRTVLNNYKDAVEWLDNRYAFFLTNVLNIGRPESDYSIPTAAVQLPEKDSGLKNFKFSFNPEFMGQNSTTTNAFVLSHETMHILLNHLALVKNFVNIDRARELQEKQKKEKLTPAELRELSGEILNSRKFNIAADCVINDYLMQNGLDPDGLDGCFGEDIVGYNCANSTVTEVFESITDQQAEEDGADGDGRGAGGFDVHDWIFNATDEEIEEAEKMWDQVKGQAPIELDDMRDDIDAQSKIDGGQMAGRGQAGNMEKWAEVHGVTMDWASLMKEIDPNIFKDKGFAPPLRPSWHAPRRKLASMYPQVLLPVTRKEYRREAITNEVPSVVMGIDTSGSITEAQKRYFITLARSIPQERIKLFTCSFNDYYNELDLENPQYYSGGTSFSAVEEYIQEKIVPEIGYPKTVVVITDGYASFGRAAPPVEFRDRWLWLIDGGQDSSGIGRSFRLKDFVVGGKGY